MSKILSHAPLRPGSGSLELPEHSEQAYLNVEKKLSSEEITVPQI